MIIGMPAAPSGHNSKVSFSLDSTLIPNGRFSQISLDWRSKKRVRFFLESDGLNSSNALIFLFLP
jgi:hypothetical protein